MYYMKWLSIDLLSGWDKIVLLDIHIMFNLTGTLLKIIYQNFNFNLKYYVNAYQLKFYVYLSISITINGKVFLFV